MNIDDVWAELEQDLAWRQAEIRLLSNTRRSLTKEEERNRFRRAQLVMLYAHTEGFCKVALSVYMKAVNSKRMLRCLACDELVASSLDGVFHALEFGDKKGKVFAAPLPTDEKLYLVSRRRDFIRELQAVMNDTLELPDSTVNTESNLSGQVLRRNLFRLGFPPDLMSSYEDSLEELAKRRHNIAHGSDDTVVRATDYDRLQKAAFEAWDELVLSIVQALENENYRRQLPLWSEMENLTTGEMR